MKHPRVLVEMQMAPLSWEPGPQVNKGSLKEPVVPLLELKTGTPIDASPYMCIEALFPTANGGSNPRLPLKMGGSAMCIPPTF